MNARLSALTLAALALVSCGGGGGAPSLPQGPALQAPTASPSGSPLPSSAPMQQVSFKIVIPAASASAHRPAYVSAATQSAAITVTPNGGSAGSPTTVNCTNVCSGSISAPVGADTFAMKLYDAQNGGGNLLSAGATTKTIVGGQANNVNVTFNGVVHSLSVSVGSGTAGTVSSPALGVNALDADGNTIVGPGSYVNASGTPVTLTLADSDASGATTLPAQTSYTAPTSGLTLGYTGLAIAPATLTVSAAGFTNATTSFTPTLQPIVITTTDAANPNFKGVDLYLAGIGSAPGQAASFTATEVGFTNAPYNQSLNFNGSPACSTIAVFSTVTTTVTANAVALPAPGMCTVTLSDTVGQSQGVPIYYTDYAYSGANVSLIVPNGVTSLNATVAGAEGGGSSSGLCVGGAGQIAQVSTLAVTSSHTLTIQAGGEGEAWDLGTAQAGKGGFGGGGNGGTVGTSGTGGGGGGASAIFDVNASGAALIVAGGGGGGSGGCVAGTTAGTGGSFGTGTELPTPIPPEDGTGGEVSIVGGFPGGLPGGGGSTSTASGGSSGPGAGGTTGGAGTGPATSGGVGVGGPGGAGSGTGGAGGGGGGGYFGGGGGGGASTGLGGGAGGGGSSFPSGATFSGPNASFGYVIIIF